MHTTQAYTPIYQDPIISELHATRQRLNELYQGDLHAYSLAATANALALGFKFYKPNSEQTEQPRNDGETQSPSLKNPAS
jgi:hypothetical protein